MRICRSIPIDWINKSREIGPVGFCSYSTNATLSMDTYLLPPGTTAVTNISTIIKNENTIIYKVLL